MRGKGVLLFASVMVVALANGLTFAQQPPRPVILVANATFQQEVHASPNTMGPSAAVGTAVLVLNAERTKVDYAATFVGLTTPVSAAHFHAAVPPATPASFGVNAGVRRNVCGGATCVEGTLFTGTWSKTDTTQALTDADITALLAGQVYFNIHTSMNPGGELRGQVTPVSPK